MPDISDHFSQADFPQKETDSSEGGFDLGHESVSSLEDLIEKLRGNYDFFAEMTDKEIVWFLRLCGRRSYKTDQPIFQEGELGNCFYLIVFGKVLITRGDMVLATLETGDCFGEMAVLDDAPRSASATAAMNTLVFSVERDILTDVFPTLGFKVAANLAKQLSVKLRDTDELIKVSTIKTKPEKATK